MIWYNISHSNLIYNIWYSTHYTYVINSNKLLLYTWSYTKQDSTILKHNVMWYHIMIYTHPKPWTMIWYYQHDIIQHNLR